MSLYLIPFGILILFLLRAGIDHTHRNRSSAGKKPVMGMIMASTETIKVILIPVVALCWALEHRVDQHEYG